MLANWFLAASFPGKAFKFGSGTRHLLKETRSKDRVPFCIKKYAIVFFAGAALCIIYDERRRDRFLSANAAKKPATVASAEGPAEKAHRMGLIIDKKPMLTHRGKAVHQQTLQISGQSKLYDAVTVYRKNRNSDIHRPCCLNSGLQRQLGPVVLTAEMGKEEVPGAFFRKPGDRLGTCSV